MSEIKWLESGSGGSLRAAPRPASAVALRNRGEVSARFERARSRRTAARPAVRSVTTALASRSTRAPSARKPPTVNVTRPLVVSRPPRRSCVGLSTR